MKQYEITLDGQVYKVSLREISEETAAQISNPSKEATKESVGDSSGKEITAPMAGNILSINVSAGDRVKAGDTLVILEAMKMENEIVSPIDGVISSILVQQNQTVDSGQLLLVI